QVLAPPAGFAVEGGVLDGPRAAAAHVFGGQSEVRQLGGGDVLVMAHRPPPLCWRMACQSLRGGQPASIHSLSSATDQSVRPPAPRGTGGGGAAPAGPGGGPAGRRGPATNSLPSGRTGARPLPQGRAGPRQARRRPCWGPGQPTCCTSLVLGRYPASRRAFSTR